MAMINFELTPKDFDGGTDERDSEILWVQAPSEEALKEFLNRRYADYTYVELPFTPPNDAIDITVGESNAEGK